MRTKPTTAQLAIPCSQCGKPVPMLNAVAVKLAKRKGITCKDCLSTPTWTKATYNEYLKSEHWQSFRVKVLDYYGRKCYLCGSEDTQLDIHHNNYTRLGCEKMSDVIPLCREHHKQYEANK